MTIQAAIKSSNNIVYFLGVYDVLNKAFINNATVTVTIKDKDGVEVAGQVWPVTLNYETGSNGDYNGMLDDSIALVAGELYTVELVLDGGPGKKLSETHILQVLEKTP